MEKKFCIKCGKELDRRGRVCKFCKIETDMRNQIRSKEEIKILRQEFIEHKPQIYEEIRRKVLEELKQNER